MALADRGKLLGLEPLEQRVLLTVSSWFSAGVLTFSGDSARDVVDIRSTAGVYGNTIEFNSGGGTTTQTDVRAIHFGGGGGPDLLTFSGSSTAVDLDVTGTSSIEIQGSLYSTGAVKISGASVTLQGKIVASSVQLFGTNALNIAGGKIRTQGGAISVGSGGGGTTFISGNLESTVASGTGKLGGTIHVYGRGIQLEGARLDASGDVAGGTILIGGGLHGADIVPNADYTSIDARSRINSSGLLRGDGGTIVVWSELNTRVTNSFITAQGGYFGGNGGLIETSGTHNLQVVGSVVDARGYQGEAGTWLLDPRNVTIASSATIGGMFNGADPDVFTPDADNAFVDRATIQNSLNDGTSVTITTGTTGTQDGDITVLDTIVRSIGVGAPTLSLVAARDILVNAAILGTVVDLNLELKAGRNINIAAPISLVNGSLTTTGMALTTTATGSVSAATIDIDQSGTVLIQSNLTAATSINIHAGNDGTGNLLFGPVAGLNSHTISLQAGIGDGTQDTAAIDVVNATFRGPIGAALTSPTNFSLRQDATITNGALPSVILPDQFGLDVPLNYAIRSDGGSVTVSTAAKVQSVAGTQLDLSGKTGVTIAAALNLASLAASITGAGTIAIDGGGVTTTGTQTYTGPVTIGINPTSLSGTAVTFVGVASTLRGSTDGGQAR